MTTQSSNFVKSSTNKTLPPRIQSNIVHRQSLLNLIHDNIQKKVLLISAPAGSGKTSLIADFISDIDIPCCWYSLETSDQDIRLLTEGMIGSLKQHFPSVGQIAHSLESVNRRPGRTNWESDQYFDNRNE